MSLRIKRRQPVPIRENILRLMSAEDRAAYGNAGLLADEASAKGARKIEKGEHELVLAWARLNAVEAIHAPTYKRSELEKGWPDFTFLWGKEFRLVEMKVSHTASKRELSADQKKVRNRLAASGIEVLVTNSALETIQALRAWLRPLGWKPQTNGT
jgi:hypothetical protein